MNSLIRPRKVSISVLAVCLIACTPSPGTSSATTTGQTSTTTSIAETTTTTGGSATTTAAPATTSTVSGDPWFEIVVVGGQPVGGVLRIEVGVGDDVRIRVTSDTSDHVHIHGYDLMFDVGDGVLAEYTFTADVFGIFEIELEDSHILIAELVVN